MYLEKASRIGRVGEVLDQVFHESKTPLMVIQAQAVLLKGVVGRLTEEAKLGVADTQVISEGVDRILMASDRIARIFKLFVDDASNLQFLSSSRVLVSEVIRDSLALLSESFKNRGIQFELEEGVSTTLEVSGDLTHVSQILTNLFLNSIEAVQGRDQPWIRLTVQADAEVFPPMVHFRVTDNGMPIPQGFRHKVFDAYFTTKKEGQGMGLGLNISKRLAEQYGGRLVLNEESSETSFVLSLPRVSVC